MNATVAGVAIAYHPSRNQTIALPGVGTIVLNHQSGGQTDLLHSWNVTAMTITITAGNTLGVPPGVIVISSATAALHEPLYRRPYGDAYGTTVNLGNGNVYSEQTAFVSLPCGGGDGRLMTNNVAAVSKPSVLSTGVVVASATSSDTASVTTANTHAHIANVSLAGGAVTATTVTATANASRNSSGITFPGSGATFVDLVINGVPFSGTPPPNTTMTIPLVGTLKLNVITTTPTGVQVYAMQLVSSVPLGALGTWCEDHRRRRSRGRLQPLAVPAPQPAARPVHRGGRRAVWGRRVTTCEPSTRSPSTPRTRCGVWSSASVPISKHRPDGPE